MRHAYLIARILMHRWLFRLQIEQDASGQKHAPYSPQLSIPYYYVLNAPNTPRAVPRARKSPRNGRSRGGRFFFFLALPVAQRQHHRT